jgi:ubiquinone/menaquinone biosynthesis C-methylase UbiE
MEDFTRRFSTRVENYVKYRPSYPQEVVTLLSRDCALTQASVVADVGSGTGLLTKLFLENGNLVHAVEPNREMREAAETLLKKYDKFRSVNGTAENTSLADESVDFIVVGQSFHWFNPKKTRKEFQRILKDDGWVALVWNIRDSQADCFMMEYKNLLDEYAIGDTPRGIGQINMDSIKKFFEPNRFKHAHSEITQTFNLHGLSGRLLSSSYTPDETHPRHAEMREDLKRLHAKHQVNGRVTLKYKTETYYGKLEKTSP